MITTITLAQGRARPIHEVAGFGDLDLNYRVPRPLQLRTILVLALWIGAISVAGAMEWPWFWRGIVVVDLFAASVVFGLAACRQWIINAPRPRQFIS
jgi:hypothetical protein